MAEKKKFLSRLADYSFARDIYRAGKRSENLMREAFAENDRLFHAFLRSEKSSRLIEMVLCSAIPNLLQCAGIGVSIYSKNPLSMLPFAAAGELTRLASRKVSRTRTKDSMDFYSSRIKMLWEGDKLVGDIRRLGEYFKKHHYEDEGEWWKR